MLKVENVTIRFGGLVAVNNVSLEINKKQIYGLIGPNGAGKTTFFNCISGVYSPEGKVFFNGSEMQGQRCFQFNEAGMSRTYQVINLFRRMSVVENVLVGMHSKLESNLFNAILRTPKQRREEEEALAKAWDLLKFVGLEHKGNSPAGSLSYGEQRLLEIVRGLAGDPKLILLDEPAAGMNSTEKRELDKLLNQILERDVIVLMVEHDMRLVMGVCDYIFVLYNGALLAQGMPEEVQNNPEVIAAYLGGDE
ncbi:MAG: ABC transporter ATP-binding protein [Oscillospiraceae bacterium]|nr:ABC transporter ATP-binding protein [Oscillospiraceae bacterium]